VFEAATWVKSVYDEIIIENQKKRKYGNQRNFLHKSLSNKWFRNGIHSLLMPERAMTSFTICDACVVGQTYLLRQKVGHAENI